MKLSFKMKNYFKINSFQIKRIENNFYCKQNECLYSNNSVIPIKIIEKFVQ